MINLEELLEKSNHLEPMPAVITKLAALVANPKSTLNDITLIISYDATLTANLLRWANSALWAQRNPVAAVKDAVVLLGAGRILQLVVGRRVRPSMKKSIPEYGLDSGELWRHAVASALAAEELNLHIKTGLPPETFTAVLLHDIGKLILKQSIDPEKLSAILEISSSNGITYIEAEQKILGFSHCEVGFRIAKHWNFSETITQSILYHHDPEKHTNPITDAVHISNIAAKSIGVGLGNEALNLFGSVNSAKRLGLSRKGFEQICFAICEKLPEVEQLYET